MCFLQGRVDVVEEFRGANFVDIDEGTRIGRCPEKTKAEVEAKLFLCGRRNKRCVFQRPGMARISGHVAKKVCVNAQGSETVVEYVRRLTKISSVDDSWEISVGERT